jgi:hypothetical protein
MVRKKRRDREEGNFCIDVFFCRCETPFLSSSCLNLKDYDYDLRSAPFNKLIDALGVLKTQNNMELIIVEASR